MLLFKVVSVSLRLFNLFCSGASFTKPIRSPGGGDSHILWCYGCYYFISIEWMKFYLASATIIEIMRMATLKVFYYSNSSPTRCSSLWVLEIHYFDEERHLTWDDCLYTWRVMNDSSPDGTVIRFNDRSAYFDYLCVTGVPHQFTCVSKLGDDYISSSPNITCTMISRPEEPWKKSEVHMQDGQYCLYSGGKTYIG
ncbi:uncharacterized protein LY79DRAFT_672141 [Colletotrichum navitas]|uniref:Uncharacterized protein n=1 Tax=Colletotrichum navitas TaxID=681940 RepID=A0AAD8PSI4_9PEZI|nr:uncharacterized protein LY79DRAFT_672141 [Colletotrichum navitas]KAK1579934.1 hypothetical protein LY79DRAFT_672141 [Colletotrichum navitas]